MNKIIALSYAAALASLAGAQWSSNPATSLHVGDISGANVQPKVRALPDGGCYISYFGPTGYSVYLQRLDPFGNEMWPHNGVLVMTRALSSTVDYELSVDAGNNALLAFNNNQSGSSQAQVQKVAPDGALRWGSNGVTLFNGSATIGNPKIQPLSDGNYIVGWSTSVSPAGFVLQKINRVGQTVGSLLQVSESGRTLTLADLKPADNGGFIILWIRPFNTSFLSSKYLYTQKFDSAMTPVWTGLGNGTSTGAGHPVEVYAPQPSSPYSYVGGSGTYGSQGGSVQNGYYPTMIPDGAGGAVYGWYENSGPRNAYVQHIHANGSLQFQTNGLPNAYTTAATMRLSCSIAYDAPNDTIYSCSAQSSSPTQGNYEIIGQKVLSNGSRAWGDSGVNVEPNQGNLVQPSFVQCQLTAAGMNVFNINLDNTSKGYIYGAGLDSNGNILFQHQNTSTDAIDTVYDSKGRLDSAASVEGFSVLGWHTGSSQVWASRVNEGGTLGLTGTQISGSVNLNLFVGPQARQLVHFEIYSGATLVESHNAFLHSDGTFSIPTHLATGTYDVYAKGAHWLRKKQTSVLIDGSTGASGLQFDQINGDVDGSNIIDLGDFDQFAAGFGLDDTDPNFVENTDLDGSTVTDLGDFDILALSFGSEGD